jgi:D-alanyl-D-alanine carboxypeptidase
VARHPLDFPPGSRFAYSNSAYPLLGMVVERVSGMPYERFVADRVFKPAGMRESRFRRAGEIVPYRASGYVDRNGVLMNGEPLRPAILAPNGLILSTAADMARWSIALTSGTLLERASVNAMTTPVRLNDGSSFNAAGIGWFFDGFRGHRMMLHNGSTAAGFSSVIYRYPDDDLSVVVLLNIDRFDIVNVLATSVAGFYVPALAVRSAGRPR